MKLNPAFFKIVYSRSAQRQEDGEDRAGGAGGNRRLSGEARAGAVFGPVIEHLREVGEARSATEIDDHFRRNFGIEGVTGACEYLADQGLIGKAPLPVRLTKKSNVDVEELAFF